MQIALSASEHLYFAGVYVVAQDGITRGVEGAYEREADVSEPDDRDTGRPFAETFSQDVRGPFPRG